MTQIRDVAIFRIEGTEADGAPRAANAIETCGYPWERIRPALEPSGVDAIPVRFEKPTSSSMTGYYAGPVDGIVITPDAHRLEAIMVHEAGHAVDALTLTDEARTALHRLMHGGAELREDCDEWGEPGAPRVNFANEGFAWLFVNAFAPEFRPSPSYGNHTLAPADVDRFRSIVLDHLPPEEPPMPPAPDPEFQDIDDSTHRPAIVKAARAGVLRGKSDTEFAPNEPVTRGQLATVLDRLGLLDR